jgi:hypothetical protein
MSKNWGVNKMKNLELEFLRWEKILDEILVELETTKSTTLKEMLEREYGQAYYAYRILQRIKNKQVTK